MAKFYGDIGFCKTLEVAPGVWKKQVTRRAYFGDILRLSSRTVSNSSSTNDDLNLSNSISIVADAYAEKHFSSMRFVELMGSYWKITNVEVQRPRLILTVGGVYNGDTTATA